MMSEYEFDHERAVPVGPLKINFDQHLVCLPDGNVVAVTPQQLDALIAIGRTNGVTVQDLAEALGVYGALDAGHDDIREEEVACSPETAKSAVYALRRLFSPIGKNVIRSKPSPYGQRYQFGE